ncbi:Protein translocase subunit SecDF [Thermoflexales bacterium]|nr:Protein translocase subunit SecDF [Thermoflexales bacterium]
MSRRTRWWLLIIIVVAVTATLVTFLPPGRALEGLGINRDLSLRQGLDLSGGSQVLLEADNCDTPNIAERLGNTRQIIENRINGLGVTEPLIQMAGECRILVELPAVDNPADAIAQLQQTGRLEWVDSGDDYYEEGAIVRTSGNPEPVAAEIVTPTETITGTLPLAGQIPDTVYPVIVSGADLVPDQLGVVLDNLTNQPQVAFQLQGEAAQRFGQHTTNNVGKFACIVLDNVVQSCPRIQSAIPDGQGVITVGSGSDEANKLVNLLRYGALPVSLRVVQSNTIGPTLGEDSIRASVIAGLMGLGAVALFMLLYYRLAGLVAVLTLTLYGFVTFAVFRLLGVTLTLPGIAGFILSVGVAVDGNTLIIERLKEELRHGRRLNTAVEVAFERAWTSIRDSNLATLITCAILFWFGNEFGASIVKGFAVTLGIGVVISLFSSVFVTRTFLHLFTDKFNFEGRPKLFGA